jgi:hypothetical protein
MMRRRKNTGATTEVIYEEMRSGKHGVRAEKAQLRAAFVAGTLERSALPNRMYLHVRARRQTGVNNNVSTQRDQL